MINLKEFEVWFVTGSQHLYGKETLKQVDVDSKKIAQYLDKSAKIPCRVIFKPVVTTPDKITSICVKANNAKNCVGLITWMHTFSPAKMWIAGLSTLKKPFVHLHIVLSGREGETLCGHLFESVVFVGEFHLQEMLGPDLERRPDAASGLSLWDLG